MRTSLLGLLGLLGLCACARTSSFAPPAPPAPPAPARAQPSVATNEPPAAATDVDHAQPTSGASATETSPNAWPPAVPPRAQAVLAQLARDNDAFVARHPARYFEGFREGQRPDVTLVACSDARFQEDDLDPTPDGQIFTVRNIGNQIALNEGSVEYGVRHLHTPVLLIVGHVACGAVRAALDDYSAASPALRRELNGLHLSLRRTHPDRPLGERWLTGVRDNVHQQVRDARQMFAGEIASGALTVVGAVYDFRNDLLHGAGRLVWVNVNGQPWPAGN